MEGSRRSQLKARSGEQREIDDVSRFLDSQVD